MKNPSTNVIEHTSTVADTTTIVTSENSDTGSVSLILVTVGGLSIMRKIKRKTVTK